MGRIIKKYGAVLSQGKITHREFLARVSALGLMAAISPAFLTTTAPAATPKKGGGDSDSVWEAVQPLR
jgi:hypothetical protein